jgi:hypothetical protein
MSNGGPEAQVFVTDGVGGMRRVGPLDSDTGTWPVRHTVRSAHAEDWMRHLGAECELRGYSQAGLSKLDAHQDDWHNASASC